MTETRAQADHQSISTSLQPDENQLTPSSAHDTALDGFLTKPDDAVGIIAHYLYFNVLNPTADASARPKSDVIRSVRDSAFAILEKSYETRLKQELGLHKTQIAKELFDDSLKMNIDKVIDENRRTYESLESTIELNSNTYRQILISVISSFVFGVVITLAVVIANFANPLKPVIDALINFSN